jgi:NADH-quinone oxidoreductase subunit A
MQARALSGIGLRALHHCREQERRAPPAAFQLASGAPFFWPDQKPPTIAADTMDLQQYLPVILFILVGVVVGIAPQVLGFVLGPQRPDAAKNSPYECGFEAFEDARVKFDVRYYLVAILFILFDLEIAFLFPWAVALRDIGASGFWAMMIFLAILVVGFVYEWKKGALDWE